MKSITIYYVGGRFSDMVLEDDGCKAICDWFKDDYGESKMEIKTNDTVKIFNKKLICQIDVNEIRG